MFGSRKRIPLGVFEAEHPLPCKQVGIRPPDSGRFVYAVKLNVQFMLRGLFLSPGERN